jgi:hypothetical protein
MMLSGLELRHCQNCLRKFHVLAGCKHVLCPVCEAERRRVRRSGESNCHVGKPLNSRKVGDGSI